MKPTFKPVLGALLLISSSVPVLADIECNVRGVSTSPGLPGAVVYAHDASGKSSAGELNVKGFLNHEADKLKFKSADIVFTLDKSPKSVDDPALTVGKCEIPANVTSFILVFVPEKGAAGGKACKVVLVDDSGKAFPAGATMVVNESAVDIRFLLEEKPFEIASGSKLLIKDPPVGERNSSMVKGFMKSGGDWKQFTSSQWPHPGQKRVLQVVSGDGAGGRVAIRGIRDVAAIR